MQIFKFDRILGLITILELYGENEFWKEVSRIENEEIAQQKLELKNLLSVSASTAVTLGYILGKLKK